MLQDDSAKKTDYRQLNNISEGKKCSYLSSRQTPPTAEEALASLINVTFSQQHFAL